MATTDADKWIAKTPEERAGKEAFSDLDASPDKVLIPTPKDAPKKTLLKSQGYFAIQAYVLTGKGFPQTVPQFEQILPKTAFRKLTDIDPEIYDKTKNTVVAVGASCSKYDGGPMHKLVDAAMLAENFCHNTLEVLEDQDSNLMQQLAILLTPMNEPTDKQKDEFEEARERAKALLGTLKNEAVDKKHEANEICGDLVAFNTETKKLLKEVQFLERQYSTGPVQNKSGHKDPYLKYLNADLTKSIAEFKKLIKQRDDDQSAYQGLIIKVAYRSFIACGMLIRDMEAIGLRDPYKKLVAQVEELKQHSLEEATLIDLVSVLVCQFEAMDQKMNAAISAMRELYELFAKQAKAYDRIAFFVGAMNSEGVQNSKSLNNRKIAITSKMKSTIAKLRELRDIADVIAEDIRNSMDQVA